MTTPLLPLLRVEVRALLRTWVCRASLAIFLSSSLLAMGMGAWRVRSENVTFSEMRREEKERYAKMVSELRAGTYARSALGDLTSPGVVGLMLGSKSVLLPPGELGVLAVGQRDVVPVAARVTTRLDPFAERYDAIQNPRHLVVGPFDLAFVIVFVFPLLVLALSYDLVSSEREQGTLSLLLSQSTAFSRILGAKIAARLVVVTLAVSMVFLVAALVGGAPFSGFLLVRWLLATLGVLLYGAFWLLLALAIQRLGKSSQTNALLTLGSWIFFVIVLPASIDATAKLAAPVPARVQLIEATRDAQRDASKNENRELARYYEDHPQFASTEALHDFWSLWVARSRHVEDAVAPLKERFSTQLAREQSIVDSFGMLSPAVMTYETLVDMAGAGQARERAFLNQSMTYSTRFRRFFEDRVLRSEALTAVDLEQVPGFVFQEEPSSSLLVRVSLRLIALMLPVLLLAIIAFMRLERVRWLDAADKKG